MGEAFTVENEIATFNLGKDRKAFIPYVRKNVKTIEEQFYNTFENVYTYQAISEWKHGQLSLMPLAIELDHGKKYVLQRLIWKTIRVCIFLLQSWYKSGVEGCLCSLS